VYANQDDTGWSSSDRNPGTYQSSRNLLVNEITHLPQLFLCNISEITHLPQLLLYNINEITHLPQLLLYNINEITHLPHLLLFNINNRNQLLTGIQFNLFQVISGILKDKGQMESLHIPNTMSIQQVNPYAMSMIQVSNVAFLPHIYYSLVYYKYITRWHCSVPGEGRRDRMVVGFTTTCAISTYHH
jgi:hypothetical protein